MTVANLSDLGAACRQAMIPQTRHLGALFLGPRKMPSTAFFLSQRENAITFLLEISITYLDRKGLDIPVPLGYLDFSNPFVGEV